MRVFGSAIHDTIKLLNGEAALELFAQIIMALVAVVSCVRKTHIGCISVLFLTLFTNTRQNDAFADSRAGCSAGRVAAPPEGTARAEVFCAFLQVRASHAS